MITINFDNLNELEKQIHEKLASYVKVDGAIRINQAANLCNCSSSKISKFVKRLGFENYKQYMEFLQGEDFSHLNASCEMTRIRKFMDNFDDGLVNELLELIYKYDKIILFGYGPSLLCAQYFEYRLRIFTNKSVVAVSDEISVISMADEKTLLIFLTVTGAFRSFEDVYNASKEKGCETILVVEEYNADLFSQFDRIFWLSNYAQPKELKPYEKSRTIFFIFFEEIIQRLINTNKALLEEKKVV